MIFRFRNIGPIRSADLELGPLTVIVGRNNTGKTYLAYTLYGLLDQWRGWPEGRYPPVRRRAGNRARRGDADTLDVAQVAASLSRDGEVVRKVDRETLERERATLAQALGTDFSRFLVRRVLSASAGEFENVDLRIEWVDAFPEAVPQVTVRATGEGTVSAAFEKGEMLFRATNGERSHPLRARALERAVGLAYTHLLLSDLPNPFVLTAERFGISLFHRELDFTKNQLVQILQRIDRRDRRNNDTPFWIIDRATSRYAKPIQDNIDYTRSLPDIRKDASDIRERRLERSIKEMMDGEYRIAEGEVRFVSRPRSGDRFNLPLHQASSSARGLSDLYFYLRHAASQRHLLIVDEPESHLDTENQVTLAHLLSKVVKAGVQVLITTHSDYIVKEINNLLMLGRLNLSRAAMRKLGYKEDLGLEEEAVRAYVAEEGGLTRCGMNAYGLDFPVFDTTIDSINSRSRKLASQVMEAEPDE